jgi:hypothetical protein
MNADANFHTHANLCELTESSRTSSGYGHMQSTSSFSPTTSEKKLAPRPAKAHFKILAPSLSAVPAAISRASVDPNTHSDLLSALQKFRGGVYREYPTIAKELLPDGRHFRPEDAGSWHILLQNDDSEIIGSARYRPLEGGYESSGVSGSALGRSKSFGPIVRNAVECDIANAESRNSQYGEAGMWALSSLARCSTAAVNIALMTFAVAEHLGGGFGLTTATTCHHSASILRRLGGRRLAGLPAYYEPMFGCIIEILHFSPGSYAAQYIPRIERLKQELSKTEVLCASYGAKSGIREARSDRLSWSRLFAATNIVPVDQISSVPLCST